MTSFAKPDQIRNWRGAKPERVRVSLLMWAFCECPRGPYRIVSGQIGRGGHGGEVQLQPCGACCEPPGAELLSFSSHDMSTSPSDAPTLAYVLVCVCVCLWWRERRRCVCAFARASGGVVVRAFIRRRGGGDWLGRGGGAWLQVGGCAISEQQCGLWMWSPNSMGISGGNRCYSSC